VVCLVSPRRVGFEHGVAGRVGYDPNGGYICAIGIWVECWSLPG